jgi:cyclic 2,3-diphosphoglycerate synthase
VLVADLVLVTTCHEEVARRLRDIAPVPVCPVELRLRPLEPVEGRVAVFTAGAADVSHLEPSFHSTSLADRGRLREELGRIDVDTYVIEIKAAAIDVVAEHALERGARVVFADNEVVGAGVDEALLALVPERVVA